MQQRVICSICVVGGLLGTSCASPKVAPPTPAAPTTRSTTPTAIPSSLDRDAVLKTARHIADWQIANPSTHSLTVWDISPLYDGLIRIARATGDAQYLAEVIRLGTQVRWSLGPRRYLADDHAVGHAWLDLYAMDKSRSERLAPTQKTFDAILAKPITENITMEADPKTPGVARHDRWTWSDALYMAPPTLAKLYALTGDERYLKFLDEEYRVTIDALRDPETGLIFRDARFIKQRAPSGKKIFWGRGNGWVAAGLPLVLESLPAGSPSRAYYEDLFCDYVADIVACQLPDGLWAPSLLDPGEKPMGETSGSAMFVFALAWGVNHGLLDRETYWPAVERGWSALSTRVSASGRPTHIQVGGDRPPTTLPAEGAFVFGVGAMIMAGTEVARGLGAIDPIADAELLARAERDLADESKPRAYVRFVPERKDDVAWENDLVAFRTYGPALKDSVEASGIDAWTKRTSRLVIDRWYADDLAGKRSYHQDHGEGFDGFTVGNSTGCGGAGVFVGDTFIVPDVYDAANILYSPATASLVELVYRYPDVEGKPLYERRRIKLKTGSRVNEITSRFSRDRAGRTPVANLRVGIGLMAQTPDAQITCDVERGELRVRDRLGNSGASIEMTAVASPGGTLVRIPHEASPRAEQAVYATTTDASGRLVYTAGYTWTGDGSAAPFIAPATTQPTTTSTPAETAPATAPATGPATSAATGAATAPSTPLP